MINIYEVAETNQMIDQENLDVRTITLGISLLDCIDSDLEKLNEKIYNKITTIAKDLVSTGQDIEKEFVNNEEDKILFKPTQECDLSLFTKEEIAIMDKVLIQLKGKEAKKLTDEAILILESFNGNTENMKAITKYLLYRNF